MLSWERFDENFLDIYLFIHPSLKKQLPSSEILFAFLNAWKPRHDFNRAVEWEIGKARNNAVISFLNKKHATHLLMLDSDIRINDDTIERLLLARKPVVSASYYEKNPNGGLCAWKHSEVPYLRAPSIDKATGQEHGLVETELLGMGCCLIERWVLEDLWEKCDKIKIEYADTVDGKQVVKEKEVADLFRFAISDTGLDNYWRVSEDFYFALQLWDKLGIRPWVDLSNIVGHEAIAYVMEKGKVVV